MRHRPKRNRFWNQEKFLSLTFQHSAVLLRQDESSCLDVRTTSTVSLVLAQSPLVRWCLHPWLDCFGPAQCLHHCWHASTPLGVFRFISYPNHSFLPGFMRSKGRWRFPITPACVWMSAFHRKINKCRLEQPAHTPITHVWPTFMHSNTQGSREPRVHLGSAETLHHSEEPRP